MIICADLHLRSTRPQNRIDDYWDAQAKKFRFILAEAVKSPPLVVAGDFFDRPRPGEGLLRWVIETLKEYQAMPIVVPGQHDLPYHSLDRIGESGLGVLAAAGVIELLLDTNMYDQQGNRYYGVPFGCNPPIIHGEDIGDNILLWHHMVIQDPLWPGQEADKAPAILLKYPQFDLICTGDNHQTFALTLNIEASVSGNLPKNARWLVNPGSMMRMTSAQADHKPCVFKWDNGKLEQIFLPCKPAEEVLDLSTINQEHQRDCRIDAFIDRLHTGYELGLDFEHNLTEYLRVNDIDMHVVNEIWESVG